MAEYFDLATISSFLDVHLIIPLLEFIKSETNLYPKEQILQEQVRVISKTKIRSLISNIYQEAKLSIPDDLQKSLDEADKTIKDMQKMLQGLVEGFQQDNSIVQKLEEIRANSQNLSEGSTACFRFLNQQHSHLGVTSFTSDVLYDYARLEFDRGNYETAANLLHYYRLLSDNLERSFYALWGKLCCKLLTKVEFDKVKPDVIELKDLIESQQVYDNVFKRDPLFQLQQRSWLIHWSLFLFFRDVKPTPAASSNATSSSTSDASESSTSSSAPQQSSTQDTNSDKAFMVELFVQDRYMNAIQTNCPHILRYLTVAIIMSSNFTNKKKAQKELIKLVEQERMAYSDPLTQFIETLYVQTNFDAVQTQLKACESVLSNDFFLRHVKNEYLESAKQTLLENFCRIHKVIDASLVAEKFELDKDSTEKWIAKLTKNTKLNIKLDSQTNRLYLRPDSHFNLQHIMAEKVDNVVARANLLKNSIEKFATKAK